MPKWHPSLLSDESVFWKFTRTLLPQLNENVRPEPAIASRCVQIPIGKKMIQTGVHEGKERPIQQRCTYCIKAVRAFEFSNRAHRTCYTCIFHLLTFSCKEGRYSCWAEANESSSEPDHSTDDEASAISGGLSSTRPTSG